MIMTEKVASLPTPAAVPSQPTASSPGPAVVKDESSHQDDTADEEPYTIKCICNFTDDDGNTIYCETCDTWQHLDCFYPNNREEATREDFAHSCADCKPRPLNRQKAIERTLRLKSVGLDDDTPGGDKKPKRPPTKTTKKKTKPADLQLNGTDASKHPSLLDSASNPAKKQKNGHRPTQSTSSQAPKRSPSQANARINPAHPPSPATTPPDLPDDFQIHHYSAGFYSLYNEQEVPETRNNSFASIAIPTALARWLHEPEVMKQEVGRTHKEVFQDEPATLEGERPELKVADATRSLDSDNTLRWRFLQSTAAVEKDVPLIELNGAIGFQKDYCTDQDNLWTDLSSPLPFVFFHPVLPLYIDTRKEGSRARYVRRSCKPNAQLDTYLSGGSDYHFWIVSDRHIAANEQITLPWDFRLEKSVCARWLRFLGLSDEDTTQESPELDNAEYNAISNWIDRILSEYGGCACELENNCAFARFHRRYLHGKNQARSIKKKQRRSRNHTVSPTSTGHATNSRAASEGHVDELTENEANHDSTSAKSKPGSRDNTPGRQGSFDQLGILTEQTDRDKRKVAMVEDSFRRMEQQQPPRKKKRVSDGAPSSKTGKPRAGYADAGTSRSKSGSPASTRSPQLPSGAFKGAAAVPKREASAPRSRQTSVGPARPQYCDAAIQTDPVEGEWFSTPMCDSGPKKRVISLSRRLLNSRLRIKTEEEERRKSMASLPAATIAMDVDAVAAAPQAATTTSEAGTGSQDTPMMDVAPTVLNEQAVKIKAKTTPDLHVQLPPPPTFDNAAVLSATITTTPLSATSSVAQSPFPGNPLPSPFSNASLNGVLANPSPIKKKLSLSDYKSRLKKGGSGPGQLKQSMSSPDDMKTEANADSASATTEKAEETQSQPIVANGTS